MNKENKLKDIINNPEKATEEELNTINETLAHLLEFKRWRESYVDTKSNCTNDKYSERYYQEHLVKAAILEAFSFNEEQDFKDLNSFVFRYLPKEFEWDMSIAFLNTMYLKMGLIGLIEVIDIKDKYNPRFRITKKGTEFLCNHTLQSLASTSFFNYSTFKLTKKIVLLSYLMLLLTIISVVIALFF